MKALADAIVTAFNADSTLKTAVSYTSDRPGFYYGLAPDDATANSNEYVVFYIISNVHTETFTQYLEDARVQFSMYSTQSSATGDGGGNSIEDLRQALWDAFDEANLTVTGYSQVMLLRENTSGPFWFDTSENWQCTCDYRMIVQKAQP